MEPGFWVNNVSGREAFKGLNNKARHHLVDDVSPWFYIQWIIYRFSSLLDLKSSAENKRDNCVRGEEHIIK